MPPHVEQVVPPWQLNRAMLFLRQYNWSHSEREQVPAEWVEEMVYYYYLGSQVIHWGLELSMWATSMFTEFARKLPWELREKIFPNVVV